MHGSKHFLPGQFVHSDIYIYSLNIRVRDPVKKGAKNKYSPVTYNMNPEKRVHFHVLFFVNKMTLV